MPDLLRSARHLEHELLLSDREIAALEHLRHDVQAVLDLEVHEVRRGDADACLDQLVQRRQFGGVGPNVGEPYRR